MAKCSKAETAARLEAMYPAVLSGLRPSQIRPYLSGLGHGWAVEIGERQMRRYVEQTRELVREAGRPDRLYLLREQLARLRDVYSLARSKKDTRACVAAVKEIADLAGLHAPETLKLALEIDSRDVRAELQAAIEKEIEARVQEGIEARLADETDVSDEEQQGDDG